MTQALTIQLPESLYQHLQTVASASKQSLEQLIYQSVQGNLPPLMPRVDVELQPDFLTMQTFSIAELKPIALSQIESKTQSRHLHLLEKNSQDTLTDKEQRELADLRQRADQLMLRKSYAWSLLRWRGYSMPKLAEIPLS